MVVTEKTVHAIVDRIAIITAVSNAAVLTRMSVEVAAFPIGRVDILIWVMEIVAMKRQWFIVDINRHKNVHCDEKTH